MLSQLVHAKQASPASHSRKESPVGQGLWHRSEASSQDVPQKKEARFMHSVFPQHLRSPPHSLSCPEGQAMEQELAASSTVQGLRAAVENVRDDKDVRTYVRTDATKGRNHSRVEPQ